MKKIIVISTFIFLTVLICPGKENIFNITSGGNFSLAVGDGSGHYIPALDFFRRFERVVRRLGRIEEGTASRQLMIVLDETQPFGTCAFEHSRIYRKQVLKMPADYNSLLDSPTAGRVLTSALLQSRFGNQPQEPLPEAAYWIADGLWAEFVQRERSGGQAVRFTWLPELRNVVENGIKLQWNLPGLTAPQVIRVGSAEWCFYVQKAQLMLEVAQSLGSSRSNLLKDYCFLLFGRQLAVEDCFDQTFSAAAKRRVFTNLVPEEVVPKDEKSAGRNALARMAMKALYSQYVPLNPLFAGEIFERICKVDLTQTQNNMEVSASITDLPFLVKKYDSCVPVPRIKMFEINELSAIAPGQLRAELYQMALLMSQIGSENPEVVSSKLKEVTAAARRKLQELAVVDSILAAEEKTNLPLLYDQRFFMYGNWRETPLPANVKSFMDTVERSLLR